MTALLSMALLWGAFSAAAPAQADGSCTASSWDDLVADASSCAAITLGGNIDSETGPSLDVSGSAVTLDLAGHTLTTQPRHGAAATQIGSGASLTLNDTGSGGSATFGSLSNAGTLTIASGVAAVIAGTTVDNSGTLTVDGSLTVAADATLDLQGTGEVTGGTATVENYGTILVGAGGSVDPAIISGVSTHSYRFTFDANGGSGLGVTGSFYVYAATVADSQQSLPTVTPPAGYSFTGWFTETTGGDRVTASTDLPDLISNQPSGWDYVLTAHYAPIPVAQYHVTFDAAGGTPIPAAQVVPAGGTVTEPATTPSKDESTFAGWYHDGQQWDFATDTVTTDLTLTAHWKPVQYTVTFNAGSLFSIFKGGPTPPAQHVDFDGLVSQPQAAPALSFQAITIPATFLGWFNGTDEWQFGKGHVTRDTTLEANYQLFGIALGSWTLRVVVAGDHLFLVSEGAPYAALDIRLQIYSTPTDIGTLHVDADGNGRALITLPDGLPAGSHTIVLSDGSGHALASIPVTAKIVRGSDGERVVVLAKDGSRSPSRGNTAGQEPGGSTSGNTAGSQPPLADTGASVVGTTAFGLVLLAIGCALSLAGSRRRRASASSR